MLFTPFSRRSCTLYKQDCFQFYFVLKLFSPTRFFDSRWKDSDFFIFLSFNPSRYFSFQIIIHLSSEFSILSHSVFETFSSILKPFYTDTVLFFLTKHTIFYFTFFQFRVTFVVTEFKSNLLTTLPCFCKFLSSIFLDFIFLPF